MQGWWVVCRQEQIAETVDDVFCLGHDDVDVVDSTNDDEQRAPAQCPVEEQRSRDQCGVDVPPEAATCVERPDASDERRDDDDDHHSPSAECTPPPGAPHNDRRQSHDTALLLARRSLSAQRAERSSVCRSVRKVYRGKTAVWIRMSFWVVSGVGQNRYFL